MKRTQIIERITFAFSTMFVTVSSATLLYLAILHA